MAEQPWFSPCDRAKTGPGGYSDTYEKAIVRGFQGRVPKIYMHSFTTPWTPKSFKM